MFLLVLYRPRLGRLFGHLRRHWQTFKARSTTSVYPFVAADSVVYAARMVVTLAMRREARVAPRLAPRASVSIATKKRPTRPCYALCLQYPAGRWPNSLK